MADNATVDKTEEPTLLNQTPPPPKTADDKLYDKSPSDQATKAKEDQTNADQGKASAEKAASDKAAAEKAAAEKAAQDKAKADAEAAAGKGKEQTQTEPRKEEPKTTPEKVPATSTDYDLKLPDGSPLSPEELAATLKEAKEAGLSKEEAEGMLETKDQTARNVIARQNQAFESTKKAWKDQTAKDPQIGGENYARNIEIASRAWDKFADAELKKIAEETGIGNHPAVIRAFLRIGNAMSEDRLVRGTTGPTPGKKSKEDILYGNPKPSTEAMV